MNEKLKNKIIEKLKATGQDVSKVIENLNVGDVFGAAVEADKLKNVDFIGIKIKSRIEIGL